MRASRHFLEIYEMKGKTPTAAEKAHWNRVAALGCIACRKDGLHNPLVSIHHVDGRTKAGAHMRVCRFARGITKTALALRG